MAGYIGSKSSVTVVSPETDSRYVNVAGDTMTGGLTVEGDLTVDTNTLFVDSANNRVGIGTDNPFDALHVEGTIRGNVSSASDENIRLTTIGGGGFVVDVDDATVANPTWSIRTFASEPLAFEVGGSEAMRIVSSGNVGIGKQSPSTALDVNGTVTATAFAGDGSGLTNLPASGPFEVLSSGTFSGDANLTLTDLDFSTYLYQIELYGVRPATDAKQLTAVFSTNNGSSFLSSNYTWAANYAVETSTSSSDGVAGASYVNVTGKALGNSGGEHGISGTLGIFQEPGKHFHTWFTGVITDNANDLRTLNSGGRNTTTTTVNAFKLLFTSGNIATGSYILYRKDRP